MGNEVFVMGGADGMGPKGGGPMTGRGMGYCMFKSHNDTPSTVEGFVGINGMPVGGCSERPDKEVDMPGGDRTGPMGMGAMTGRAAGNCVGNTVPGRMTPGMGRGQGYGGQGGRGAGRGAGRGRARGMGLGRGSWDMPYETAPTKEQELAMLQSQAESVQGALADIQQRISEVETDAGEKK